MEPTAPTHADLLNSLVQAGFSLPHVARAHNLSAARILAFSRDPHVRADLAELARFARALADLAARHARPLALATLRTVATDPDADPTERRRAATAILASRQGGTPRYGGSPNRRTSCAPPPPSFNLSDLLHQPAQPAAPEPETEEADDDLLDHLADLDHAAQQEAALDEPEHEHDPDQLEALAEELRDVVMPLLPILSAPEPTPTQRETLARALAPDALTLWQQSPARASLCSTRTAILEDIQPADTSRPPTRQTSAAATLKLDTADLALSFSRTSPSAPWRLNSLPNPPNPPA